MSYHNDPAPATLIEAMTETFEMFGGETLDRMLTILGLPNSGELGDGTPNVEWTRERKLALAEFYADHADRLTRTASHLTHCASGLHAWVLRDLVRDQQVAASVVWLAQNTDHTTAGLN